MKERIILKVYENKRTGQRLVCIPKKYKRIRAGNFVEVIKKEVI